MERLTKRIGNSVVYSEFNSNNSDGCYEMLDNCLHKLAEYEDAEEQGLLLRLPCKVGDTVYSVVKDGLQIFELKFSLDFYVRRMSDFGKTVFLTKEEAGQALETMKRG